MTRHRFLSGEITREMATRELVAYGYTLRMATILVDYWMEWKNR